LRFWIVINLYSLYFLDFLVRNEVAYYYFLLPDLMNRKIQWRV
jgi:hypothetical protein